MSRVHLSWWSMILGRKCPGAVIWGQFFLVGILRGAIVQGELSCSLWRGWDEWRANVGGMLLLMLLLLLKCYPEEENNECQLLKKNEKKMFQIDLDSDLREEPDLMSRCWFTLFGPVMQGS